MVKFKRALSTLLVVAMVFALMPAFALAATGGIIELPFNKNYVNTSSASAANELCTASDALYDVVQSKTTTQNFGGSNTGYLSVNGRQSSSNNVTPWVGQSSASPTGQFTIKTKNSSLPAGNYKVTMDAASVYSTGGMVYVYIGGKYIGFYDSWANGMNSAKDKDIPVGYVSVSEEDATAGVEIMFAYAARSGGASNTDGSYKNNGIFMIMSGMNFEEVETIPSYSTVELNVLDEGVTAFPTELAIDGATTFNAKAQLSDGSYRHLNGYAADKNTDLDNKITVISSDDTILKVETLNDFTDSANMYTYDGEAAYKLTGLADGDVTLTITATIGGVAQTPVVKNIKVGAGSVVEPEPEPEPTDEPVYLFFGSNYMDRNDTNEDGTKSSNELTAKAGVGYTLVADETTTAIYGSGTYCIAPLGGKDGNDVTTWVAYRQANDTNNYGQFTISAEGLEAASYKVSVADYAFMSSGENRGGKVYVYVGDKYVGMYNGSDFTGTTAPSTTTNYIDVGYVTLTAADIASGTKIRFCFAGRGNESVSKSLYMPLSGIKLEKADSPTTYTMKSTLYSVDESQNLTEITDTSVLSKLTSGTRTDISVKLNERHLNNYGADGVYDADNAITVTSSDEKVISVTDLEVATQNSRMGKYSDTPSYVLTAEGEGTATITVTAKIDNKEVATETYTLTVPSTEPGEKAPENVSFGVLQTGGANADITVSGVDGYTVGQPGTAALGTTIGLEAAKTSATGAKFAYWKIGKAVLSTEAITSYKLNTNTAITAVYDNENAETKTLELWSANGALLESLTGNEITPEAVAAVQPTLTGYGALTGWYVAEGEELNIANLTKAVTRAVAQHSETGVAVGDKNYGDLVPESAEGATYWTRTIRGEEKVVAYGADYKYYVWDETEIKSYTDEVDAEPVVVLDDYANGSYMIEYFVPAGYTKVEAGILYGLSGEPTIGAANSKAVSKRSDKHGQLTAAPSSATETVVRGYLIYEKAGVKRVIYTDVVNVGQ